MVSTNYLVCYDITENPTRSAVASVCKGNGLVRIQKSVFFGYLSSSQLREIRLNIREIIKDTNSNVHFVKVCSSCERDHSVVVSVAIPDENESSEDNIQYHQQENMYDEEREEFEFDKGVIVL